MICYEKAYYLNLGRYGAKNINTDYFKLKIEIFNDMMKNSNTNAGSLSSNTSNSLNFNSSEHQTPIKEYKENSKFSNFRNNLHKSEKSMKSEKSDTELQKTNITPGILGGFTYFSSTFKFQITHSNTSEPLIISIYDLQTNTHNENIFIKNLYFDKNHLCKLLKLNPLNTPLLYKENNILKIINSIILVNGKISVLDNALKMALLNTKGIGGVRPYSSKSNLKDPSHGKVPYLINKK